MCVDPHISIHHTPLPVHLRFTIIVDPEPREQDFILVSRVRALVSRLDISITHHWKSSILATTGKDQGKGADLQIFLRLRRAHAAFEDQAPEGRVVEVVDVALLSSI